MNREQVSHDRDREIQELRHIISGLTRASALDSSWQMKAWYALEGNGDGLWDWDAETGHVYFSSRLKGMLGFEEDEFEDRLEEWSSRIHPADISRVMAELKAYLSGETPSYESEHRLMCKDGSWKWILDRGKIMEWTEDGRPKRLVGTHTDITARKKAELENIRLVSDLRDALAHVRQLSGLLPICSSCKRVRGDRGYWEQVDAYVARHTTVSFSHGLCPECAADFLADAERADGPAAPGPR